MLKMKPTCERCAATLPADRTGAIICSFECTFCEACAEGELAVLMARLETSARQRLSWVSTRQTDRPVSGQPTIRRALKERLASPVKGIHSTLQFSSPARWENP